MRILGLIFCLVLLAACEPSQTPRPEPSASTSGAGISVSGYGRVGVSTLR